MPINFPSKELEEDIDNAIEWVEETKRKFVSGNNGELPSLLSSIDGPSLLQVQELRAAYTSEFKDISKNKWINTVDNIHDEIKGGENFLKMLIDYTHILENKTSQDIASSAEFLKYPKREYKLANERYKFKKNLNSANKILKMDSYDKNIEENFFIMYYLLSYGVIGFFIYKLVKL
jgi:hypothetical protein